MTFDEEVKQRFAKNFNYYLDKSDKSAAEIARMLNIDRSTVSWWKTGRSTPTIERTQQLANIFGCNLSDLLAPDLPDIVLSESERYFIDKYRKADDTTKQMIDRLLAYQTMMSRDKA